MAASSPSFVLCPLRNVQVHRLDGVPDRIDICGCSSARGFLGGRIARDDGAAFDAALAIAEGRMTNPTPLSADQTMRLWQAGAVMVPDERTTALLAGRFLADADGFARDGFTAVDDCIAADGVALLTAHVQRLLARGALRSDDPHTARYWEHNDPASRVVQALLTRPLQRLIGRPIKPSYTYLSLYRENAELRVHVDRAQCQYTLSLLIDHRPLPPDGVGPWPVCVYPDGPLGPPVECRQRLGGGIVLRGNELHHGRPRLPWGQSCWVMLLHYVDADFDGPLD